MSSEVDVEMCPPGWSLTALTGYVTHKSGDSKIIKGKQSSAPASGLVQGYSASGPDVWVKQAHYHGPGIVVSAVGARCGKTFLADGQWTAIANTHAIIPKHGLDPKFFWYVTNREEWWVKSGTAQPFVKVKDTLERPFAMPPIEEQREIVRILEEQFSRLDAAAASVVALRRALDRCHASLLFNLLREPTDAGLAARWRTVSVSEVVSDIRNGLTYKNDPTSGGLPIARIQTISCGRVNRDLVGFAGLASVDSKYLLEDGDILFSHINSLPHLGKVALFRANSGALVHGMNLLRLRVVPDVYPQFLHYAFCGDAVRMQVRARAQHAVNQASINIQSLKAIELPLPPYEEQMRIADAIETYETQIDKVSQALAAVEKKIGNLRRALLRAAFSGEISGDWRSRNNG